MAVSSRRRKPGFSVCGSGGAAPVSGDGTLAAARDAGAANGAVAMKIEERPGKLLHVHVFDLVSKHALALAGG
jgi:hypothetical protein